MKTTTRIGIVLIISCAFFAVEIASESIYWTCLVPVS